MPWLMKYHCLHIPFSEVRGSEKLFWKVSEKKLVASHSFPRPGRAKSGHWRSWQDTRWWNNVSWSKVNCIVITAVQPQPVFRSHLHLALMAPGAVINHNWDLVTERGGSRGWAQPRLPPPGRHDGPEVLVTVWKQVGKPARGTWWPALLRYTAGAQGVEGRSTRGNNIPVSSKE